MVQIESECFSLPKAGNRKDEYEDAFCRSIVIDDHTAYYKYAVADGASESSFADIWADLLANAYCNGKAEFDSKHIHKSISKLSKVWRRKLNVKDLPWYAQEKLNSGAFSTLAGITFRLTEASSAAFDAVAIGDSCIFHIRGDKIITSFPLDSVDDFHNRPVLISSNAANNIQLKTYVRKWNGIALTGDFFFLMSDALACWTLNNYEEDPSVLTKLRGLTSDQDFIHFVQAERQINLRNDDVTLIRVHLS